MLYDDDSATSDRAEKSQDDQASSLLQVICNGGSPSVEIFIAVLEESDQYKALGETLRMDRVRMNVRLNIFSY